MNKKNYIIAIFILSILIVFILPIWNVQDIQVTGLNNYTQEEIELAIEHNPGNHILSYNKDKIEEELSRLPYIKTAEVEYKLPNSLIIHIEERILIGYVAFLDGYICIDEEGYAINHMETKQQEFPVIEGLEFDSFKVGNLLELENFHKLDLANEIVNVLKRYNFVDKVDTIELTNIEEIHLYVNKLNVIIGSMVEIDQKVKWLIEIYENYPMGILDLTLITDDTKYDQAVLKPLN